MEIKGADPLTGSNNNVQRTDAAGQPGPARKSDAAASDIDRLEPPAQRPGIAHLEELIRSTPDVRESRIEEIRGELEKGTYNVKAEKIAEKMIGDTLMDEIFRARSKDNPNGQ